MENQSLRKSEYSGSLIMVMAFLIVLMNTATANDPIVSRLSLNYDDAGLNVVDKALNIFELMNTEDNLPSKNLIEIFSQRISKRREDIGLFPMNPCWILGFVGHQQVGISAPTFWTLLTRKNSKPMFSYALFLKKSSNNDFLILHDYCLKVVLSQCSCLTTTTHRSEFVKLPIWTVDDANPVHNEKLTYSSHHDFGKYFQGCVHLANEPATEIRTHSPTGTAVVTLLVNVLFHLLYAYHHSNDDLCIFFGGGGFYCHVIGTWLVSEMLCQLAWETSRSQRNLIRKPPCVWCLSGWMILMCMLFQSSMACTDIRGDLSGYECLHHDPISSTFYLTCSFDWTNNTKCIVLLRNENFEGNGYSIDLNGVSNWEGLFQISTDSINGPSSFDDAPVIRDVHMIGGETSGEGGFIVQSKQSHFVVKNCSSSGAIHGTCAGGCKGGGGICGQNCAGNILITHCWSSGEIHRGAGGIAGRRFGRDTKTATISYCYSSGNIVGQWGGGICGSNSGTFTIEQCCSLGEISGERSGGISGANTARAGNHVSIINCYSRGAIKGKYNAGGICGELAGIESGTVTLTNVYASGKIVDSDAGGLIGSVSGDAMHISITMSVYYGEEGDMIGLNEAEGETTQEKNSGVIEDIIGTVYCYYDAGNPSPDECWDTEKIWEAQQDDYPTLLNKQSNTEMKMASNTPSSAPTVTSTRTVTPSFSPSKTGTMTSSVSPTASSSETSTSSQTVTPSATPSKGTDTNGTLSVVSGCGTINEFHCTTIHYDRFIILEKVPQLEGSSFNATMEIKAQAIDGMIPSVSVVCGTQVDNTMVNSVECSKANSVKTRIPVYSDVRTIGNTSCHGRIRTDRCRLYFMAVLLYFNDVPISEATADSGLRSLTEQARRRPPMYMISTSVLIGYESIVAAHQTLEFNDSIHLEQFDVAVEPLAFSLTVQRDIYTSLSQNFTVKVVSSHNLLISWKLSSSLFGLLISPEPENLFQGQTDEGQLVIKEQVLLVKLRILPHGKTTGLAYITFSRDGKPVKTFTRDVLITVVEANAKIGQSTIQVFESITQTVSYHQLALTNTGTASLRWMSRSVQLSNMTSPPSWINFPLGGLVSEGSEDMIAIRLLPARTSGPGLFETWILLETDTLMGDHQDLVEQFGPTQPPALDDTMGVFFWIHVRLTVHSIFVCQEFGSEISLLPRQEKDISLKILNTDIHAVFIKLDNFTITMLNDSTPPGIATTIDSGNKLDITEAIRNRVIRVTPWWQVSPSTLLIPRRMSKAIRIKIGYMGPFLGFFHQVMKLPPARYELRFSMLVHFESHLNLPVTNFVHTLEISFKPGFASVDHSYLERSNTSGVVGETLVFSLVLLDEFGYGPATVMKTSQPNRVNQPGFPPYLVITTFSPDILPRWDTPILPGMLSSQSSGRVLFEITLQEEGQTLLDARLNNVSINEFPVKITTNAFQCRGRFEIFSGKRRECLCQKGYVRNHHYICAPCPAGTFAAKSSNTDTCSSCAQGFFAEEGSLSCIRCARKGVDCQEGILLMKQGFWCELCQEGLSIPRKAVISELRDGHQGLFHQCVPPEACHVNTSSFVSICTQGYSPDGPVCSKCEDGFVKAADGKCAMCGSKAREITLTLITFTIVVVMMFAVGSLSHRDTVSYEGEEMSSGGQYSTAESTCKTITNPVFQPSTMSSEIEVRLSDDKRKKGTVEADSFTNGTHQLSKNPMLGLPQDDRIWRKESLLLDVFSNSTYNQKLRKNLVSIRHLVLMALDYLQITFILHQMEISPFTKSASWIVPVIDQSRFNPSRASAFQCTFSSNPLQTALLAMASPVAILLGLVLVQFFITCRRKNGKAPFPWKVWFLSWTRSSIIILNLVHMSISQETLRLFAVYSVPIDSTKRAEWDLTIRTESSKYRQLQILAIVTLTLFVIGYPCITLFYYMRRHMQVRSPQELWSFVKLTGEFRVNGMGFMWESIVVLRKLSLLLVAQFVEGAYAQLVYTVMILTLSLITMGLVLPYRKTIVNIVQYLMIFTCICNSCFGFVMNVLEKHSVYKSHSNLQLLSYVVGLLQILFFLSLVLVTISMTPKAAKAIQGFLQHCRIYLSKRTHRQNLQTVKLPSVGEPERLPELPMSQREHTSSGGNLIFKGSAVKAFRVSRPSNSRITQLQQARNHKKRKRQEGDHPLL